MQSCIPEWGRSSEFSIFSTAIYLGRTGNRRASYWTVCPFARSLSASDLGQWRSSVRSSDAIRPPCSTVASVEWWACPVPYPLKRLASAIWLAIWFSPMAAAAGWWSPPAYPSCLWLFQRHSRGIAGEERWDVDELMSWWVGELPKFTKR